ncbi:MAG: hypothetical protein QNJ65_03485 [Xenococcaceae cyanobacterium MO_234.B1]|nr:hypothetical protein [Xenococcaceae cyanobacterium MO_234.B1]
MSDKIQQILDRANAQLKLANTGITIFRRGNKLSLRGMLPPKPGSKSKTPTQQTISLGIYANAAGIKVAKSEAQKLSAAIALKEFDWKNYSNKNQSIGSVGYWLNKFEEDYFNKRPRNTKTETTWQDYQKIFKKLPLEVELDKEILLQAILSTTPNTRTRQKCCIYIKALAKFANLDFDPTPYSGNYSAESLELRDIPTDLEIVKWRDRIPSKSGWLYAFELMAAYGLRNYELFYCDLESLKKPPGHLRILESKRGKKQERFIWCLYPEWWEMWELGNIERPFPQVTGKNNSELGNRVTQALGRYGFNKPYNLRHAWAIRSIGFIPIELAAPMMDHKIEEHTQTYHRWIKKSQYEIFYQLMMDRPGRPLPPS